MEGKWTYPPEVPDTNRRVLAAYRNYESPVKGFYGPCSKLWFTFEEDIDILQDHVYAWRELPKLPPLPEDREDKKEFFPHGTKVKVVGWEKVTVLGDPMLVPVLEEIEGNDP